MIEESGNKSISVDGITATMIPKTSIKYTDEYSLMEALKNKGYGAFVVESVNTKEFNDTFKKSALFVELFGNFVKQETTCTLTVK